MRIINLLIVAIILVIAMGAASGATFYCENCTDCTEKIQNAQYGDTVILTENIVGGESTNFINFENKSGITFDGAGYTIDCNNVGATNGIAMITGAEYNIVKNCYITGFDAGIYIVNANYNTFENITSSYNRGQGITVLYSTGTILTNCTVQENVWEDFYFRPDGGSGCNTTVVNLIGSGDRPIGFYNEYGAVVNDTEFSALYLCYASGSTFDNITVSGSDMFDNNAVRMYYTTDTVMSNFTANDNYYGIYLKYCTDCDVNDSVFIDNNYYGVYVDGGNYNNIYNTEVSGCSQRGVIIKDALGCELIDINVHDNILGMLMDHASGSLLTGSRIENNVIGGLTFTQNANCLIYNNIFDNSNDLNIYGTMYPNRWNVTNRTETNIIGGQFMGGNYWAQRQFVADDNQDGFGDEPYILFESPLNADYLTLVMLSDPEMYIRNAGQELTVGDTFEYMVTCRNSSGFDCDCGDLVWSSSNKTVGIMNGANITCYFAGETNITVTGFEGLDDTITQVVNTPIGINEVYFEPTICSDCDTIQIRMNTTYWIDSWQTNIEFDPTKINITDVDFTGSIATDYASWHNYGSYITIAAFDLDSDIGDKLLATLTIVCVNDSSSQLNFSGEEGISKLLAVSTFDSDGYPIAFVYDNVIWNNGSVICDTVIICGDVNDDGIVSANDVIETYNRAIDPNYVLVNLWAADVDGNNDITSNDVVEIYRRSIDLEYPLNCI